MQKAYCGLDAGSKTFHMVVMDPLGNILRSERFDTSEVNLVRAFDGLTVHLEVHSEAMELAGWIRGVLRDRVPLVTRVVIGDPKKNAWIAKDPNKDDDVDAFKLADLLRMGKVHEVYYPDREDLALFKKIVQHYDDLTEQQVRIKQKIKARLRANGVICIGEAVYGAQGRESALAKITSPVAREVIEQLYELLDQTLTAQEKAFKLMKRESRRYPQIARFQEVPGFKLILASRYFAYIQTAFRFGSKSKICRYCQLGITNRRSDGKLLQRRRLDRNGNSRLKDLSRKAFEAAMRTKKDNAFKRAYRSSLQRTQNPIHARLSTQRKIVATLWGMWKGGTRYQDDRG